MSLRVLPVASALALLALVAEARAQDLSGLPPRQLETFKDFVLRLGDVPATLRMESEFAGRIDGNDRSGIRSMSARIRKTDGPALRLMLSKPDLALVLGPCHYASLHLRGAVRQVAEGNAKAVRRGDVIAVSGSEAADKFARMAQVCEIVQKLPPTRRKVGTQCLISGQGCS